MDPDQPTRRIPPVQPPPAPVQGTPVVQDDRLVVAELADRVRSLRGWLALATVLALLALGLAAWALLTQEEEQDAQAGATREQVERLDARVDDLESRIDDRATKDSVSDLRSDQEELAEQVDELTKAAEGGDSDAVEQNIEQLDENMQQLQQRMDELEQQQSEQPPPG